MMLWWPSSAWTVLRSFPAASERLAAPWRRSWKRTGGRPAWSARRRKAWVRWLGLGGPPSRPANRNAEPLVEAGLPRQVPKQVPQVRAGVPQPAGLGGEPEQGLHHRQGDQLGVGELRGDPHPRSPRRQMRRLLQQVIGLDVQCGREGVQVVRHKTIMDTLAFASLPLGITRLGALELAAARRRASGAVSGHVCGRPERV